MDCDDQDEPTQAAAAATPSRFAPNSKQPPRPTPEAAAETAVATPEPPPKDAAPPTPAVVVEKEEESQSSVEPKMEESQSSVEEEDHVVAEFDVYFCPNDSDTQVNVLQYPMRPSWRPYELDQRCTEVRVKPSSAELEMDLSIDMDSDNYNSDAPNADKMKHLTLSSHFVPPSQGIAYAVGVLMGKKLCSFVHQCNILTVQPKTKGPLVWRMLGHQRSRVGGLVMLVYCSIWS